ncbi:hypothetical protein Sarmat_00245 [Rickettsiales endosymbiont of Paramecium tredecaurelia]|uniref:hypothetical protein n=1 Tax=Candidatus Sarmatiella mevalonica TaxID=2770581 RepID=UPI0019236F77|nr:hypothetical protein [Candidatus Sarmatiella mevalonica]MBL3284402.1 hypothetical protein [Candidatus Sarmatiella mevalonica]
MITLCAVIAGFLAPSLLEIVNIIGAQKRRKFQKQLIEIEPKKKDYQLLLNMHEQLNRREDKLEKLNSSVRPIIAYGLFGIYFLIKVTSYFVLAKSGQLDVLISQIWSEDDRAIFSGIISFYFGQRVCSRINHNK